MDFYYSIVLWSMIAIAAIGLHILNKQDYALTEMKTIGKISERNKQIIYYIILILVFLVGMGIRLYALGELPGGIHVDEAMASVDAYALATQGTDRFGMSYPVHFTAWEYGQMSVLMSYLMVPFIKIFGYSAEIVRLPTAIMSIVGMGIMYFLALEMSEDLFEKKKSDMESKIFALIVFAFVAINPWHITQSRWAIDCNMLPHFFIIGIYFLMKGSKKTRYYYISMIFFAACMYSYGLAFLSIPLFLIIACIYLLWKKQIKWLEVLQSALIYIVLSLPIYLVMFINTVHWDTIKLGPVTIPRFEGSVRSSEMIFYAEDKWDQLVINYKMLVNLIFYQSEPCIWNLVPEFGHIYLFSLPFVILGVVILLKKSKGKAKIELMNFSLLVAILIGLIVERVNTNRINIIFYSIIFLQALGVYYAVRALNKKRVKGYVLLIYTIFFVLFTKTYFTTYQESLQVPFNKGFEDAFEYANELNPEIFYISRRVDSFGADDNPKPAEILTVFHNKIEIPYYQGETNVEHGIKRLTYSLRYQYIAFDPSQISDEMGCVYILPDIFWDSFDENKYDKVRFTRYFVSSLKADE